MAAKPQPEPLAHYWSKRNFALTGEPRGAVAASGTELAFVVQKHHASRLHYDFRLELGGVMLSWAVPKGPSFDPKDMRMAIHVEDHPLSYNRFEGTIPPRQYGAGTVIVWDEGTWEPAVDPHQGLKDGKLVFTLHGHKLLGSGSWCASPSPATSRSRGCCSRSAIATPGRTASTTWSVRCPTAWSPSR